MSRPSARARLGLPSLVALASLASCAPPPAEAPSSAAVEATAPDSAADAAALGSLLDGFLANAGSVAAHERFWADDLIYTSSRGTRTTKTEILSGMGSGEGGAQAGPTYRAEDVDVRLYGTTAVVAFRLVIEPPAGSGEEPSWNLNTGTFVKRDGEWRAVAWQSTVGAREEDGPP